MKKFRLLVAIMTTAMIGLAAVQWYWVQNAITLKNEAFDRNVKEALTNTVAKIEQQELVFETKRRIDSAERKKLARITQKKTIRQLPTRRQVYDTIIINQPIVRNDFRGFEAAPFSEVEEIMWQDLTQQRRFNENELSGLLNERHRRINQYFNEMADWMNPQIVFKSDTMLALKPQEKQKQVFRKKNIEEAISGKKTLFERLDRVMLDTLLKKELEKMGLNLPYFFGAKDAGKVVFSTIKKPETLPELNTYRAALFPNDIYSESQQLFVHFPLKQNYIFNKSLNMVGLSIFLIGFVGFIFFKTMTTMLQQKKLDEIKNDFINNMTHEFRTPISTISLATQILSDQTLKKDQSVDKKYLTMIRDENQRLGQHVERVLQMAQMDRGEFKLQPIEINIDELIENITPSFGLLIASKKGNINLNLNAKDCFIKADEVHLTNLIHNLVENAIKYSSEIPHILIETKEEEKELCISIIDNGPGIKKEDINKIFDKFYRVATGNIHEVKGFGLGLSYVKSVVEAHKGRIEVSSEMGKGTSFKVFLRRGLTFV